jgi:zinc-binding alcohol dehydrogenase/oxidoreductase
MLALQLDASHQPAVARDLAMPQPAACEVLIKLHAAALNHRDVWIQKGQYAGIRLPCTLGADGAGEIAALGEGVEGWAVGAPVIVYPGLEWGDAAHTQGRNFRVLGMPDPGTFAEYTTAAARYVRPRPAHLSWEQAAALPLAGLTAYRAAFGRAQVQPGERVLVTGVGGGVAQVAAQFCAAAGAEVWVTSGEEEKVARALALPLGLRGGISYKQANWGRTLLQNTGGFDVIIDSAVGEAFGTLLDVAAPGGRIVFYGATLGNPQLPAAKVFWKQLSILGTSMGSEQDFDAMLAFVNQHQLVPVVDKTFPLAEGEAALRYLEAGQQLGKVVLTC